MFYVSLATLRLQYVVCFVLVHLSRFPFSSSVDDHSEKGWTATEFFFRPVGCAATVAAKVANLQTRRQLMITNTYPRRRYLVAGPLAIIIIIK